MFIWRMAVPELPISIAWKINNFRKINKLQEMCDAAWDYDTIAEVPESAEAILWRTGGPVFLLGNPPDPLSGKRYDDSGQCEQPVWRCFGRHHGFRLEAPSGACRRGGGKRYV